jgi:hypothetical protein
MAAFAAKTPTRPVPVKKEHARPPIIKLIGGNNAFKEFAAWEKSAKNGGFLAAGDIDGDGVDEFVVGSGMGMAPFVNLFEADGKFIREIRPYADSFKGGVRVATGDLDGDGIDEIFTAPGPGIPSYVTAFSAKGEKRFQATAFDKSFVGGAHIASADLDADGKTEIIISPGPGGGPHIRVFDGTLQNVKYDFFAYDASMTDGVSITTIRTPKGPAIVTAPESWNMPLVRTWQPANGMMGVATEFLAADSESRFGVTLASYDLDYDGYDEIAGSSNGGKTPDVQIFDWYGTPYLRLPYADTEYRGAISLVQAKLNPNSANSLFSITTLPTITGPVDSDKSIVVNITEQRLYAYEHGRTAKTFLISSGTRSHPTPIAKTTVKKKIPKMDYRWNYGPNNPNNYFLPNVKYNLNILPHIYIHYAYWHNNFGNRMSHGCINTGLDDAAWIYNWVEVGIPVETLN